MLVGAATALVASVCYRILLETAGYFAWLSSEAAKIDSVWFQKVGHGLLFWAHDPMGSLMIAVAPTVAAGGLAGFAIGALVQGTRRRPAHFRIASGVLTWPILPTSSPRTVSSRTSTIALSSTSAAR
jgi:hypothetical protein